MHSGTAPRHTMRKGVIAMSEERETNIRTFSDVMALPAREGAPIVARVAPAVNEIVEKTGILKLLFNNVVATVNDPRAMAKLNAKEQAKLRARMVSIGEQIISVVLKSMGECMPQYLEILAALNGVSTDELQDRYTTGQLFDMVKTLVTDSGFLASVQTLAK